MKRVFLLCLLFFGVTSLEAQYQMDLRNVQPASIKYIQMGNSGLKGKEIKVNNLYMEEGGVPKLPVMGEFHYLRMDRRYWKDALLKMKASGVDIVATYALWMLHEEVEGRQNWTGNCDLRHFLELCEEVGLKVHLRIGPYCNAEIVDGALPDWMVGNKSFRCRTNDPLYLEYVRNWYRSVYRQIDGLLYKDGGPIMAIQLENEYVMPGLVVSHLMNLKRMAVAEGFDVPLYTMTHWMSSEYPKGEIVPYAGFYIETPWISHGDKLPPPSSFEYFAYDRVADNIGTDIIKVKNGIESLEGQGNDSPFFTCEIGVGTTTFYHRRAVVPEEMAGENINLRLGCGANLMGYYMYVGGSNPVGEKRLFGTNPAIGYDYQAPIREFGTLGVVMKETKKMNYLMNDFGGDLAVKVAYLPTSNQNKENLQWAVRSDGKSGYLFCSNYLYKHDRPDYKNVQFDLSLKNETLKIPRSKATIRNKAYFMWPFNLSLGTTLLKYATVQPICTHVADDIKSYFFFADDDVPAEYLIADTGIADIQVSNGICRKEKGLYFIDGLVPGMECVISIVQTDGKKVRLVTLTEEESDYIWKGRVQGRDFVIITRSSLVYDGNRIVLTDETPNQEAWEYEAVPRSFFTKRLFGGKPSVPMYTTCRLLPPMADACWIGSQAGDGVRRSFNGESLAEASSVTLRYLADGGSKCLFNGSVPEVRKMGEYFLADLTPLFKRGENQICFEKIGEKNKVLAEIEVIFKNGARLIWNTDNTWLSGSGNVPVKMLECGGRPLAYAPGEHLTVYEFQVPKISKEQEEARLSINFVGDLAVAYIGNSMVNDRYYDGSDWILGLSRYRYLLQSSPLIVKIKGFSSINKGIYLESFANQQEGIFPRIKSIETKQEYRYEM